MPYVGGLHHRYALRRSPSSIGAEPVLLALRAQVEKPAMVSLL
jgi:hypothetical protein